MPFSHKLTRCLSVSVYKNAFWQLHRIIIHLISWGRHFWNEVGGQLCLRPVREEGEKGLCSPVTPRNSLSWEVWPLGGIRSDLACRSHAEEIPKAENDCLWVCCFCTVLAFFKKKQKHHYTVPKYHVDQWFFKCGPGPAALTPSGNMWECRLPGPVPDPLAGVVICALTSPPGACDARWSLRIIAVGLWRCIKLALPFDDKLTYVLWFHSLLPEQCGHLLFHILKDPSPPPQWGSPYPSPHPASYTSLSTLQHLQGSLHCLPLTAALSLHPTRKFSINPGKMGT